jgi:hypothetical protein
MRAACPAHLKTEKERNDVKFVKVVSRRGLIPKHLEKGALEILHDIPYS